ncbi:MAG TPA: hypothetical protein VE544_07540 [Nitrososphaeraceae archaeon]|jgi:hypothetical protein|nr:hypothetical protein [Nitrososphaeraceae archaeon]
MQPWGRRNLFKIADIKQSVSKPISAGDWENCFMKSLGFGKFMVFEFDESSNDETPNFTSPVINTPRFVERLERAKAGLKRMKDFMRRGQWDQVVEQLRDVDLIKSDMKEDVKELFSVTMDLPKDRSQALTTALDNLYSFSSQPHHAVRKGEINPIIRVNKEDADFAFMVMFAITQLLEKKLQVLKRSQVSF